MDSVEFSGPVIGRERPARPRRSCRSCVEAPGMVLCGGAGAFSDAVRAFLHDVESG